MKSTFLLTLLLVSITSFAQIKKGAYSIGADVLFAGNKTTYTNSNNSDQKNTAILLSFTAGKAIKDNLFVGAGISYLSQNSKSAYTGNASSEQKFNSIGGSLWVRKYYPVLKSFYLFVNGGLSVAGISGENISSAVITQKQSGISMQANLYPGISYQMHKNFFLDASINNLLSLSYSKTKTDNKDNQGATTSTANSSNYALASSIGSGTNPLQIGIRWIIQK
ncbi:MAG: outer membrane beta-barrel protein [Chitinophagaceae bacterium]|nr:outer membrane beta-barrel protein [Chitinophagaceae bacterium]